MAKQRSLLAGNSLVLMPKIRPRGNNRREEGANWAKLGVDAHHANGNSNRDAPWYTYSGGNFCCATPEPRRFNWGETLEVILHDQLTVENLPRMMANVLNIGRTKSRFKILMARKRAFFFFPADTYAI